MNKVVQKVATVNMRCYFTLKINIKKIKLENTSLEMTHVIRHKDHLLTFV